MCMYTGTGVSQALLRSALALTLGLYILAERGCWSWGRVSSRTYSKGVPSHAECLLYCTFRL
jgi:hypothetical protein